MEEKVTEEKKLENEREGKEMENETGEKETEAVVLYYIGSLIILIF